MPTDSEDEIKVGGDDRKSRTMLSGGIWQKWEDMHMDTHLCVIKYLIIKIVNAVMCVAFKPYVSFYRHPRTRRRRRIGWWDTLMILISTTPFSALLLIQLYLSHCLEWMLQRNMWVASTFLLPPLFRKFRHRSDNCNIIAFRHHASLGHKKVAAQRFKTLTQVKLLSYNSQYLLWGGLRIQM